MQFLLHPEIFSHFQMTAILDLTRKILGRLCTLAFFAVAWVPVSQALPVLDKTFGNAGIARIGGPGGAEDSPSAAFLQSDGKLLVAGFSTGRQSSAVVQRLLADGALDPTFGQGGIVFPTLPAGYISYASASQQIEENADGSIVLGRLAWRAGAQSLILTRLTRAGVLDTPFGENGMFTVDIESEYTASHFGRFVRQADGGLLIATSFVQGKQFAIRLTRLDAAGKRDLSFAPAGEKLLVNLPAGFTIVDENSFAAGADGGFTVMANSRTDAVPRTYLLMRVSATGILNPLFGTGGIKAGSELGNPQDRAISVVSGQDGKLLLMGEIQNAQDYPSGKIAVWRLTAGGLMDTTFGQNGRIEFGVGETYGLHYILAALPNAKFALIRKSWPDAGHGPDNYGESITRFTGSGALDTGFGTAGNAPVALPGYDGFKPLSLVADNSGSMWLLGTAIFKIECYGARACTADGQDIAVAALDPAGRMQPGYGRGNGFAVWNQAQYSQDGVNSIIVTSSGKLVLAGWSNEGSVYDYLITRFTANGILDNTFGTAGRISPRQFIHFSGAIRAIESPSEATTVVNGTAYGSYGNGGDVTAFRLDKSGSIDTRFTPALKPPQSGNENIALGTRPDGRFLYGAASAYGGAVLEQHLPDGTLDASFGFNGSLSFPMEEGEAAHRYADLRVLADGSVVFAVLTTKRLRVFKVDATGKPIASFGFEGEYSFANSIASTTPVIADPYYLSLLSLADGTLLVSVASVSGNPTLLTIRLSSNGALIAATPVFVRKESSLPVFSMTATADSSVLIAVSRYDNGSWVSDLLRLLPNGTTDAGFGAGGVFRLSGMLGINAMAIDRDQKLLVAGQDASGAILARYNLDGISSGTPVVEFYHPTLDHYFITANLNEAAAIDAGSAGPGWIRTGNSFKSGGSSAVCRFYGSQSPGPNAHFYTISASECDGLKQLQANTPATQKRWNFESLDFLSTAPANGICPSGTLPVYRAYNNGFARGVDSSHRITSSASAIQEVVARGWINEGVVMCAPN
ncbi:hypothetical protein BH11PSE11_BH11PSE11_22640 [soil metagenome]